jgi:aspartate carbamoyltransferase catalytic subunit
MVGDLLYSRTIHSLIYLLSPSRNVEIFLVSPKELKLPPAYKTFLKARGINPVRNSHLAGPTRAAERRDISNGIKFQEWNNLKTALPKIDVLYITRIQKERFSSARLYEKVKNSFVLDKKLLNQLGGQAVIMHPLPRVNEISQEIDSDHRAAYFRQAQNGLYIRMALLKLLLERSA